jgi:WD40 repeat protein
MIIWLKIFINKKKIVIYNKFTDSTHQLYIYIHIYISVSRVIHFSCMCHPKDITNVAFHRSYPLFASCSDDGTAYVFHGTVYSDLNQNPLVVPLEILRGHASSNGRGESFEYLLLLSSGCFVGREWRLQR